MSTPLDARSLGRGAMWSILNGFAAQGLSLLVFLITARFVSKEAFGIMAVSLLTVEAFRQVIITGFATTLAAKKDPSEHDYNACFLLIFASGAIAAAGLFVLAEPISGLLGHPEITDTLRYICLILLTAGLSQTHEIWLMKHIMFKTQAVRAVVSVLVGGGVGIYMAVNGYGLNALIAQQVVTAVTTVVFLWWATSWRPGLKTDKASVSYMIHYSKYIFMSRAVGFAGTQSDIFFASHYLGAAATGSYNAAKRILLAIGITLTSALGSVTMPALAAVGHGNENLGKGFMRASTLTSLITAPLYLGLFVLADDAVRILIGEEWLDAAPILSALVIASYLTSVGQYNNTIFLVCGKPQWEMTLNIVYTAANIALFVWLARYGAVVLAAAFSLRALALYPAGLLPALKLTNISVWRYLREMSPSVLSAVAMAFAVYFLKVGPLADLHVLARTAILVPVGAALYAGFIILVDRQHAMEVLHIVRKVVRK